MTQNINIVHKLLKDNSSHSNDICIKDDQLTMYEKQLNEYIITIDHLDSLLACFDLKMVMKSELGNIINFDLKKEWNYYSNNQDVINYNNTIIKIKMQFQEQFEKLTDTVIDYLKVKDAILTNICYNNENNDKNDNRGILKLDKILDKQNIYLLTYDSKVNIAENVFFDLVILQCKHIIKELNYKNYTFDSYDFNKWAWNFDKLNKVAFDRCKINNFIAQSIPYGLNEINFCNSIVNFNIKNNFCDELMNVVNFKFDPPKTTQKINTELTINKNQENENENDNNNNNYNDNQRFEDISFILDNDISDNGSLN